MERVSPGATIPEIPSLLPGLRRSAVLASQDQLDNLVRDIKIIYYLVRDIKTIWYMQEKKEGLM